jgi:hypothetical protein
MLSQVVQLLTPLMVEEVMTLLPVLVVMTHFLVVMVMTPSPRHQPVITQSLVEQEMILLISAVH